MPGSVVPVEVPETPSVVGSGPVLPPVCESLPPIVESVPVPVPLTLTPEVVGAAVSPVEPADVEPPDSVADADIAVLSPQATDSTETTTIEPMENE